MHPVQRQAYKAMTPDQKLKITLGLYYLARRIKKAELKRIHPEWSKKMINNKVREIFLYART
jgi:hypothetical protein